MKKWIIRLIAIAAILGTAYGVYAYIKSIPTRTEEIATTVVKRGDVVIRSFARGELQAVRSVTLTAPNLFGSVQVTRLAPVGSYAREKDLIVEFDDAELLARLEEKELEIEQVDQQIAKARADLAIRDNQDQVDLLRARYAVRRAELEVKRNELISAIDAKRNLLNLEEARRRLKQLESDIASRRQQAEAEIAVLNENRNKALLEKQREQRRLNDVKMLSPISGLVAIKQNRSQGMMFGMQVPDIREGDEVSPGTPVADILDISELQINAKVGELDRANLREDQNVSIRLDAIPGKNFPGKIRSLSGTATSNVFSGDPSKKFDVYFTIDMRQLLSTLGAKPGEIDQILAAAARNRNKAPAGMSGGGGLPGGMMARMAIAGGGGMPGGAGFPGGGGLGQAGGPQAGGFAGGGGFQGGGGGFQGPEGAQVGGRGEGEGGGRRAFGGQGGAGGFQMSPEMREKMRAAMQKELNGKQIQDLSQEERQALFQKLRSQLGITGGGPQGAAGGPAGGGGRSREGGGAAPGGERPAGGGGGAQGAGTGRGFAGMPMLSFGPGQQFSAADLENAKLPPPPEESDRLDVLLRPGLLADVEITVEKLANVLHIPLQAVFEKEGKQVVYVKAVKGFETRVIKPLKQSESMLVVESGLREGEAIALSNPEAQATEKKAEEKKPSGGAPMTMPAGGGRGGRS